MNDDVARRLRDFAVYVVGDDKHGWQKAFAGRVGVSPQNLHSYLAGRTGVGTGFQARLRALGCNVEWLMTGKGSMTETKTEPLRRINVQNLTNAGGSMLSKEEEYTYIPESLIEEEEPLAFRVPDDSMAGVVWQGDVIFVREKGEAQDGDLCLVTISGGERLIRNIVKSEAEVILLATHAPLCKVSRSKITDMKRVICANIEGVHLRRT